MNTSLLTFVFLIVSNFSQQGPKADCRQIAIHVGNSHEPLKYLRLSHQPKSCNNIPINGLNPEWPPYDQNGPLRLKSVIQNDMPDTVLVARTDQSAGWNDEIVLQCEFCKDQPDSGRDLSPISFWQTKIETSKCEREQKLQIPDESKHYMPECQNGKYLPQQCAHDDACWCMNGDERIPNSEHNYVHTGPEHCDKMIREHTAVEHLSKCQQEAVEASKHNQPGPMCDKDGNYMPMQCMHNKCRCVDDDGKTLQGTDAQRGLLRCVDTKGNRIPHCHIWSAMSRNSRYSPTCEKTGEFTPLQCDKTGMCWCVDEVGNVDDKSHGAKGTVQCLPHGLEPESQPETAPASNEPSIFENQPDVETEEAVPSHVDSEEPVSNEIAEPPIGHVQEDIVEVSQMEEEEQSDPIEEFQPEEIVEGSQLEETLEESQPEEIPQQSYQTGESVEALVENEWREAVYMNQYPHGIEIYFPQSGQIELYQDKSHVRKPVEPEEIPATPENTETSLEFEPDLELEREIGEVEIESQSEEISASEEIVTEESLYPPPEIISEGNVPPSEEIASEEIADIESVHAESQEIKLPPEDVPEEVPRPNTGLGRMGRMYQPPPPEEVPGSWKPLPPLDQSDSNIDEVSFRFDADYDSLIPNEAAKLKFARELEISLQAVVPGIMVADILRGSIIALVRGSTDRLSFARDAVASTGLSLPSFGTLPLIPKIEPQTEENQELVLDNIDPIPEEVEENSVVEDVNLDLEEHSLDIEGDIPSDFDIDGDIPSGLDPIDDLGPLDLEGDIEIPADDGSFNLEEGSLDIAGDLEPSDFDIDGDIPAGLDPIDDLGPLDLDGDLEPEINMEPNDEPIIDLEPLEVPHDVVDLEPLEVGDEVVDLEPLEVEEVGAMAPDLPEVELEPVETLEPMADYVESEMEPEIEKNDYYDNAHVAEEDSESMMEPPSDSDEGGMAPPDMSVPDLYADDEYIQLEEITSPEVSETYDDSTVELTPPPEILAQSETVTQLENSDSDSCPEPAPPKEWSVKELLEELDFRIAEMESSMSSSEVESHILSLQHTHARLLHMIGKEEVSDTNFVMRYVSKILRSGIEKVDEHKIPSKVTHVFSRTDVLLITLANMLFLFLLPDQKGFHSIFFCVILTTFLVLSLRLQLPTLSTLLSIDLIYLITPYVMERIF